MKNTKFLTLAAAVILTSCTANEESTDNTPVEIRLSSTLSVQSRGDYSAMNTRFPSGQSVKVYVEKVGANRPSDNLLYDQYLTTDGEDNFTGGEPMYFPQSGDNVNICAFHANLTGTPPTGLWQASLTHQVALDQSIAGDYSSDLLYAQRDDVTRTKIPVLLTFHHLLSKVQVAVKAGAGEPNLAGATITIENTLQGATFALDDSGDVDAVAGDVVSIIVASDLAGDDITTDFTTDAVYHDAIIVPQTLSAGTRFIKVHLASGSDLYYAIPDDDVIFESGKNYLYDITVNLTGLTVTSTIADWTPAAVDATGGNAEMVIPPVPYPV
jgi:hypothetical protein